MKYAICTTAQDAARIQAEDDAKAGMPIPGRFVDGTLAPHGWGVTLHVYPVTTKPDGKAYAYPVPDSATPAKATVVDALPADWAPKDPTANPAEDSGEGEEAKPR